MDKRGGRSQSAGHSCFVRSRGAIVAAAIMLFAAPALAGCAEKGSLSTPTAARQNSGTGGGIVGSSTPPTTVQVPSIVGLRVSDAAELMQRNGFTGVPALFQSRYVANHSVSQDFIVEQDPPPGGTLANNAAIKIIVSAGGPVLPFSALPEPAQAFARSLTGYDTSEPVLLSRTAQGDAYKTDAWLFGPCPAVQSAYRSYLDPAYDRACY